MGGFFVPAFASWHFPVPTLPVRDVFEVLDFARLPAGFMMGRTSGALFAHRIISPIVIVTLGAAAWQRWARA